MKNKIIVSIFIILFVTTGCAKANKEEVIKNKLKYNTSENIIKEQQIGDIKISNISLTYKDNNSTFKSTITNITQEAIYLNEIHIIVKDKNNNEIVKLIGFIGKNLESNKKEVIVTSTSIDLSNANSVEYILIK
ncbi:MAG: hypothetical protein PHQ64_04210 [Bacilli bacterium]|nr:hypothetical protein [Bacilli bacterium]